MAGEERCLTHTIQHLLLKLLAKFHGHLWTIFRVIPKKTFRLLTVVTAYIFYFKQSHTIKNIGFGIRVDDSLLFAKMSSHSSTRSGLVSDRTGLVVVAVSAQTCLQYQFSSSPRRGRSIWSRSRTPDRQCNSAQMRERQYSTQRRWRCQPRPFTSCLSVGLAVAGHNVQSVRWTHRTFWQLYAVNDHRSFFSNVLVMRRTFPWKDYNWTSFFSTPVLYLWVVFWKKRFPRFTCVWVFFK